MKHLLPMHLLKLNQHKALNCSPVVKTGLFFTSIVAMQHQEIGRIVAIHGTQGHLVLRHALGRKSALDKVKAIILSSGNTGSLPYFLLEAKARTADETLLLLEETDTREKAAKLMNKTVSLLQADFERLVDKQSTLGLVGYSIIENDKVLGIIEDIVEQPNQIIAYTTINDKEVLIPLHQQTIKKIDRKLKKVLVALPAGLLDIYLA